MVLSMAFQSVSETNTHRVYAKDALRVQIPAEEGNYAAYSTNMKHPMYAPLQPDTINKMFREKEIWNNWQTVIDFVVSLVL